jgi:Rrf2 family protein
MLISKETDYALRMMRLLAQGGPFTSAQISDGAVVPKPFAYKILKKLADARLVAATRGARGGYRLVCDVEQTSLYAVIDAIEKDTAIAPCMCAGYKCQWRHHNGTCHAHSRLCQLQARLDQMLRDVPLSELVFDSYEP